MSSRQAKRQRTISPRTLVITGFLVLCVGIVVLGFRPAARSTGSSIQANGTDVNNAALVAQGKLVYAAQCASCHGANLEGQPNWQADLPTGGRLAPPHDVTGHTWHHNDESLFTTVKYGGQATSPPGYKNNMPAFSQLSDSDIWAVLTYIKSTWPPDIQAAQSQGHQ